MTLNKHTMCERRKLNTYIHVIFIPLQLNALISSLSFAYVLVNLSITLFSMGQVKYDIIINRFLKVEELF